MDFSQVTGVRRYSPLDKIQSDLRYITHVAKGQGGALTCLWKRPLSYPAMGFYLTYPTIAATGAKWIEHQTSWALIDKYGIACNWSSVNGKGTTNVKNADGSYSFYRTKVHLYVSTGGQSQSANAILWPNPYGDTILQAYMVYNEAELMEYPVKATHPVINNSGLVFSFSDVTTKKIKLYAMPIFTDEDLDSVRQWHPATSILRTTYKDYEPQLREHETDVVVDAGEPLVTLGSPQAGAVKITGMRTNLDDYKAKYDVATGGKFPKSQYPYLRATIVLDAKNTGAGIQTNKNVIHWDMMYLTFEVER